MIGDGMRSLCGNRLFRLVGFMAMMVGYDWFFSNLTQDRMTYNAILALSLAWATEPSK